MRHLPALVPAPLKLSLVALVALLAHSACGREGAPQETRGAAMTKVDPNAAPAPAPTPTPVPVGAGAQLADRELEIVEPSARARVRIKLPASWEVHETQLVLRDELKEAVAGVQFTVVCDEGCGDEELAKIPQILDRTFETKTRPNLGTGDPALDALRMNVELIVEGDLPDGKFRAARVTRPAGARGPYRDQLYAVCVRARKGAKVVAAQAWAPLDKEAELGEVIVTACKTFEIL